MEEPWPIVHQELFAAARAWVKHESSDDAVEEICQILEKLNEVEGAPFVYACELGRMMAILIARYMAALNEEIPSREEIMREMDILEMEYIEEAVLAEEECSKDCGTPGSS